MYEPYLDIRERLGEPLWHDWQGVPRYDPYSPGMQNIYAKYDCLFLVRCQSCGREFQVGACADSFEFRMQIDVPRAPVLPKRGDGGSFGFGDAPWHDMGNRCAGTTMGTIPVRVMEFWQNERAGWKRLPQHEVPLDGAGEG